MKKLLALVLALVMTMSLVTISNAAFSDVDKIDHSEAVEVLNTLGVINGMPDGSFNPDGNVTRAEMAKMISIIMLGDVDASAFVGTATGLTDIKGHWAEGYIQYCYSQGIIAGRGDGTFAPNANVTTVEAAKMLLGAIGYNATVQGYTGADWAINVTRDAQVSGFFEDLKGLGSAKALNRDEAAQMIYNAVVADLIVKTPVLNVTTGTLQYEYRPDPDKSLMTETFGAIKVEGYVVANEYAALSDSSTALKAGKTEIVVTNRDENKTWGNNAGTAHETFNVSTGADELGKTVIMYVKPAASSTNAARATVLGKAFLSSDNVVATTNGSFSKASKLDDFLKDAGLKTSLSGALYCVNGVIQWTDDNRNGAYDNDEEDTFAYTDAVKGYTTQFIDNNDDGYVDYVLQTAYDFGQVTTYSAAKETITINNTVKFTDKDDVVGFDKVAKEDYVLYAVIGGVLYVEKVEPISGKVNAFNKDSITMDGTSYDRSGVASVAGTKSLSLSSTDPAFAESALYLDKCGNFVAIDSSAVTNYCLVIGYTAADSKIAYGEKVAVVFADGTSGTYTFDSSDNGTGKHNHVTVADIQAADTNDGNDAVLCSYKLAGSEIYLTQIGNIDAKTINTLDYKSGASLFASTGSDVIPTNNYVTDSTVIFMVTMQSGGTGTVVKSVKAYVGGKNMPSLDLNNATKYVLSASSSGNIKAMAILVNTSDSVGVSDSVLYVTKLANKSDGYATVYAVIGDEFKTIQVKDYADEIGAYAYSMDGEQYKLGSAATMDESFEAIAKVTGKTVVVNGKEYKVDASTVIALIDGKDSEILTIGDLRANDTVLVYDDDNDDTAEAIYVMEQYDATNAALLAVTDATNSQWYADGNTYETKATAVADAKADFAFSAKATVKIVADGSVTTLAGAIGASDVGSMTTSNDYDIIVISESQTVFAKYDLSCVASFS